MVELKQFLGELEAFSFGFFAFPDVLKRYHSISNFALYIKDWCSPNLYRNNLVGLADFHIINGRTFPFQCPQQGVAIAGVKLLTTCEIDLINLCQLLVSGIGNYSFAKNLLCGLIGVVG